MRAIHACISLPQLEHMMPTEARKGCWSLEIIVWAAKYVMGIESKPIANTSCLKQLSKEK